jgi:4'-phosphopantetheinyl transferase
LARWWVRKEAVLKATGFGLGIDPTDVEVSAPREPPSIVGWRGDGRPRSLRMSDLSIDEGHVAAVAVLTRSALRVSLAHTPLSALRW